MQSCIKNRQILPWGGVWHFVHPESGARLRASSIDGIKKLTKEHHLQLNYPVGLKFDQWVEDQLCLSQPNECVPCNSERKHFRVARLDYQTVLRGTSVLLGLLGHKILHAVGLGDDPLVSQDEANRRASICANCPYNVDFQKPCNFLCPELQAVVNFVKGDRHTPHDGALNSCAICGCFASAHCWVSLPLLARGVTEQQQRDFKEAEKEVGCWKQVP